MRQRMEDVLGRHRIEIAGGFVRQERARRVGDQRHSFGKFDARGKFGVRNEIDQQAVEQIDVIGPELCGVLEEQYGSAIRCAASARRCGSPCLTISSSPGISDVAAVINTLKNRRVA